MTEFNARHLVPVYANTDNNTIVHDFVNVKKLEREEKVEKLKKRYGLALIALFAWAASMMIGCCVTGVIVRHNAVKQTETRLAAEYEEQLEAYKREQAEAEQAAHWLSGDASREAAMNQDAEALAHDGGVWKSENAYKAYCANVIIRIWRADYPNSVKEVLSQPGQYDFYSPDGTYSKEKFDWAKEVLEAMKGGELPRYLTIDHQYLEMKNGGTDCVLHTSFPLYTSNDDPWRWQ